MAEYGKIIQAIDGFDTYAKDVVKNCEEFLQFAIKTGSEIGSLASNFSTKALVTGKSKNAMGTIGLGILSVFGEDIGKGLGNIVGNFKKGYEYENAKEKILKDGLEYKKRALHLIPESLSIFDRYSQVYELSLNEALSKISIGATDDEHERELEVLSIRNEVRNLFQIEYRRDLGNQIISYFEQFEQKLSDLEVFAQWFDSKILSTKRDTYLRCNYIIHTKLLAEVKDEKIRERIDEDFEVLKGITPIIELSGKDSEKILYEISKKLEADLKNKRYEQSSYPAFFYNESGFNRLYLCFKNHFNDNIMPKYTIFKNDLISKLRKKSIIISIVIFVLFIFLGVVKDKGLMQSLLLITVPVLSVSTLIFLIKTSAFKKELFSYPVEKCLQENPELLKASVRSLVEEFTEDEKNGDSGKLYSQVENFVKSFEQQSIETTEKNSNQVSEDDMLAAIMQTGSIDSEVTIQNENNSHGNNITANNIEPAEENTKMTNFSSIKKLVDEINNSEWIKWVEKFKNNDSAESVYFELNHYPSESDCFLFIVIKDKDGKEVSSHKWKLNFEVNYNKLNKKILVLKD